MNTKCEEKGKDHWECITINFGRRNGGTYPMRNER
jgi:hypothetical protein